LAVAPLSDTSDTTTDTATDTATAAPAALPGDGLREGVIDLLRADIGEGLLDTYLVPQTDLWLRVSAESWLAAGTSLKAQGFDYFCFISAIDWMPSPYGKGEDDPTVEKAPLSTEIKQGYAGGESRFQLFARLTDLRRHFGVTIKADVPDSLSMPTWIPLYAGANWHERETHEMFGITFAGHPDMRNLYLPGEFEGFPLRKDFPLLSRMVKPWPGIVDVEPMPAVEGVAVDEATPAGEIPVGEAPSGDAPAEDAAPADAPLADDADGAPS
jgi:NADH-quinone oxidoreductase subunit C